MATNSTPNSDPMAQMTPNAQNSTQGDANNSTLSPMENHHVIDNDKADLMTMSTPPHLLSAVLGAGPSEDGESKSRRIFNHRNQTSDLWYTFGAGDDDPEDAIALQKEREERVRRVREHQEETRRQKLEELRQHAMAQQKFREQQITEHRKRLEEQRARDQDKFIQVEERRKAIEIAEKERREALLKKNLEREEKILAKKKSWQEKNSHIAFGSSTPRMGYPVARTDSSSEVARSSSSMMMSQSMYSQRNSSERESGTHRATSVHNLDKSVNEEGESDLMTQSYYQPSASAHRRRTDLMPTITFSNASPASGISRASTPGTRMLTRSPGRSPSAMSGTDTPATSASVKMRLSGQPRRPRPVSIATTGMMSSSMYEKRTTSSNVNTPTRPNISSGFDKTKTPEPRTTKKPLSKSLSTENEDVKSNSSSTTSMSKTPRKTPAQVKKISAARKEKPKTTTPVKEDKPTEIEVPTSDIPIREATPDIIRKSPVKEVSNSAPVPVAPQTPTEVAPAEPETPVSAPSENGDSEDTPSKKIIQSEEEAKARLAEKRREMKEKMEREAELERQRQLEAERLEAERKAKEEEEERKAMEEAERLAAEARKAEEDRLQKAIEEAKKREEEEKRKKEEEESRKKEAERKAQEEAERKQAELDEKLKKEEEERLARKKRLDEIMARTRKGNNSASSTPKKEPQEQHQNGESNGASHSGEQNSSSASNNNNPAQTNGETTHSSLDPAGDPTKPDLLGDIVVSNNGPVSNEEIATNNDDLEKGIVDMNISEQTKDEEKLMNEKNENNLLDLDPVPVNLKQAPEEAQPEFDQILDLSNEATSAGVAPPPATPLIAFEDSINSSPKQEVLASDLLS